MRQALIAAFILMVGVAAVAATPLPYRNSEYGFSIQLPDPGWKTIPFPGGLVAFGTRNPIRQVGIQVRKEPVEHFESTIRSFHRLTASLPNLLQKAHQYRGKTAAGNPVAYIEVIEWNDQDRPVVIAVAHTRIPKTDSTIVTTYQGQLTIQGKNLDRKEINLEEAQAKAVCLSVDALP